MILFLKNKRDKNKDRSFCGASSLSYNIEFLPITEDILMIFWEAGTQNVTTIFNWKNKALEASITKEKEGNIVEKVFLSFENRTATYSTL